MVQSDEDLLCAEAPALLAGSNCAACSRGSQETVITAAFVKPLAQHNDQSFRLAAPAQHLQQQFLLLEKAVVVEMASRPDKPQCRVSSKSVSAANHAVSNR